MKNNEMIRNPELTRLCRNVKDLCACGEYAQCTSAICRAMQLYPHAPQPHNLLGVVLEKTGDHISAMKHFRAAWALDPTYYPASQNLTAYGTFASHQEVNFGENEEPEEAPLKYEVEYNSQGVGHVIRRNA